MLEWSYDREGKFVKLWLENISKSFDGKPLFTDTSMVFEKGKIYGLLGRNGVGKTTLFNCIAKNMNLESGKILLEKEGFEKADYPNTEIGFIQTQPKLPDFLTGYEFIKFFMEINRSKIAVTDTPKSILNKIAIDEEEQHRLIRDYSHGTKNKIQMMVNLMIKPPVILLDEPLTSFDLLSAHDMKEVILELKKDCIIIFSTHILQLAVDLCDEIVLLHNHHLQQLPPEQLTQPDFEEHIIRLLQEKGGH